MKQYPCEKTQERSRSMGQYLNELYARNFTLQCENKALRRTIDEFKNGKRYS